VFTIARLRRSCENLERMARRAARSSVGEKAWDAMLAEKVRGGIEPDPDGDWNEGDWHQRELDLQGFRRFYHGYIIARSLGLDGADFLRRKAYAAEPERAELSSGYVVKCYPLTLYRADRMAERMVLLRDLTTRCQQIDKLPPRQARWMVYRMDRERLWQRCAMMHEATLPPGSLAELPIDAPWFARVLSGVYAWLDGANRWYREFWRLRAGAGRLYRWADKALPSAMRFLGVPPWWTFAATGEDEIVVVRTQLKANDERIMNLPPLSHAGTAPSWGWSGFIVQQAKERGIPEAYLRDRTMAAMLTEASQMREMQLAEMKAAERKSREQRMAAKGKRN
jgi:hypothetical protein